MDSKLTLHPIHKKVAYLEYKKQQQPVFYYPTGLYVENLCSCYEQLDRMFSYHRKVTVVMIQFHQYQYSHDNKQLSTLMSRLISKLKSHYQSKRIGYFWAREEGSNGKLHYHAAIMLNGSVCKSPFFIYQHAKAIWETLFPQNYVWLPKRSTFLLSRSELVSCELRKARMRLSYFAKKETKESVPFGTKKFGCSQIKVR
ncbi:inovirus-type Gp2 protein [Vibrio parahaemolyticus]|nr:inovirus-type Gp2 protein [Vibrio alginolyticus]EKM3678718.1 inovirus-type Gp2 protein [Vibrio alginolyticus]